MTGTACILDAFAEMLKVMTLSGESGRRTPTTRYLGMVYAYQYRV